MYKRLLQPIVIVETDLDGQRYTVIYYERQQDFNGSVLTHASKRHYLHNIMVHHTLKGSKKTDVGLQQLDQHPLWNTV